MFFNIKKNYKLFYKRKFIESLMNHNEGNR